MTVGDCQNKLLKLQSNIQTLQLCNFLTIHSHGSILGSFESQEPQLSFFPTGCQVDQRQKKEKNEAIFLAKKMKICNEKMIFFLTIYNIMTVPKL